MYFVLFEILDSKLWLQKNVNYYQPENLKGNPLGNSVTVVWVTNIESVVLYIVAARLAVLENSSSRPCGCSLFWRNLLSMVRDDEDQ